MKTVLFLLSLAYVSRLTRSAVVGDIVVMVLMPRADDLSEEEKNKIGELEKNFSPSERNLRSQRRLDPFWCERACQGSRFPDCQLWHRECYDHRRRAEEGEFHAPHLKLCELTSTSADCEGEQQKILYELKQVMSTEESIHILDESSMTCFEIIEEYSILSFNLWNADTDLILGETIEDGAVICKGLYEINIEAVTDACVDEVTFELQGPLGYMHTHTELQALYMMFGNVGTIIKGRTLDDGVYSLTAVPDNNLELAVSLSFTLDSSC